MLVANPQTIFSWTFDVSRQGRNVASVSVRWLKEAGQLALDGKIYVLGRERWMNGDFYLERRGRRIATATKAVSRCFEISTGTERYTLGAKSPFHRTFVLERGNREIGSIRPAGLFARKAIIELADELPLETQLFITWLVIVMWKRAAANSG